MTTESEAHFKSIPWCAKLLDDPSLKTMVPSFKDLELAPQETFVGVTLNTQKTIKDCLCFYSTHNASENLRVPEIRMLFDLGGDLGGHPGIAHGGFISTLLDEVLGHVIVANEAIWVDPGTRQMKFIYQTKFLNVTFKKPLPLPGVVLGYTRITKVDGRKVFLKATIEDGSGLIYAEADSLFIAVSPRL